MAQRVQAGPIELSELRSFGAAAGVALTTTAGLTVIPKGTDYVSVAARNFSGAAVARFLLNPLLTIVVTTDLLVTGTEGQTMSPTALSAYPTQVISGEMQDGDTTDFAMDDFDDLAAGCAIYVGAGIQFRGVRVDIGTNPQDSARTLTVKYPAHADGTWTDISNDEGTDVSGDCLKQDGDEAWAVPSLWAKTTLNATGDTVLQEPWATTPMYWTRWEVDDVLDADWDLAGMLSLNRSTDYPGIIEGEAFDTYVNTYDALQGVSCVEALTDAGTANLVCRAGVVPFNRGNTRKFA